MSSRFSSDSSETSPSLLSKLSRAVTRNSPPTNRPANNHSVDDFFGWRPSTSQDNDSIQDHKAPAFPPEFDVFSRSESQLSWLPSYHFHDKRPVYHYTCQPEPVTLAMYLFKLGFLFPPFWILGSLVLIAPLRPYTDSAPTSALPTSWLPEKTEGARHQITRRLRKVELKWAKRCLFALVFVVSASGLGIGIWMLFRVTSGLKKLSSPSV
ncbi:hypothetical protein K435DRAFT_746813 [Dendrothele bispora CBS 962.96]|uniref:Uncharacterized protein n=1 Tax=Dendrothele bispora (strain CBS 962.96) TaxID=1314807 RepID=A0A4S8MNB9_DENBC|nr:hypothetical protein K435DRAFT_746813 [Dendrothele bispora CBS 962.96]